MVVSRCVRGNQLRLSISGLHGTVSRSGARDCRSATVVRLVCGSHMEVPQQEKKRKRNRVGWRGGESSIGPRSLGPSAGR
jgi:hypothetical protein